MIRNSSARLTLPPETSTTPSSSTTIRPLAPMMGSPGTHSSSRWPRRAHSRVVMVAGADGPRLRMFSEPETSTRPGPPNVAPMTSTRPRIVDGVNGAAVEEELAACLDRQLAVRGDVEGYQLCLLSGADHRRATGRDADVGVAEAKGGDAEGPVGVVLPLVVGVGINPQSLSRHWE